MKVKQGHAKRNIISTEIILLFSPLVKYLSKNFYTVRISTPVDTKSAWDLLVIYDYAAAFTTLLIKKHSKSDKRHRKPCRQATRFRPSSGKLNRGKAQVE